MTISTLPHVIPDATCEDCNSPATVVIRGETDSFGYETIHLCASCAAAVASDQTAYLSASDVEDRAPAPGCLFYVSECTNYDGHGDWCNHFISYRNACSYYRTAEHAAARWSGLYPGKGVQEIPADEARQRVAAYRMAQRREDEAVEAWEEERQAEDESHEYWASEQ